MRKSSPHFVREAPPYLIVDNLISLNPHRRPFLKHLKESVISGDTKSPVTHTPQSLAQIISTMESLSKSSPDFANIYHALSREERDALSKKLTLIGRVHCFKQEVSRLANEQYDKKNEEHEEKLL